ncbi:hypothetical protein K7T73_15965 [Bacillus badius]|uniref:hypothetical protein n=1 Tax=Bacillus badius TaxID=1455 RepID=UPI001CBE2974|nr:hypothetical protein [Bacillus badius]UAT30034.1 hypothetical protein K7T73_15965 [Bacillus badius]
MLDEKSILRMFDDGSSLDEISSAVGRSPRTIEDFLRKKGYRKHLGKWVTKKEKDSIIAKNRRKRNAALTEDEQELARWIITLRQLDEKDKDSLNFRFPRKLNNRLNSFVDRFGLQKTQTAIVALDQFLIKYEQ